MSAFGEERTSHHIHTPIPQEQNGVVTIAVRCRLLLPTYPMNEHDLLSYYAEPSPFTGIGRFIEEVEAVGADAGDISKFVQGLLIHNALSSIYDVTFPEERTVEMQLHGVDALFERAKKLNPSRLAEVRTPSQRVVVVCRHFATIFVAVMRSKGIPARVRCGFANYFEPGKHLDHWVAEYWDQEIGRWVLVDAQVDDIQRRHFDIRLDTLDLPRDRFLVAGDAWKACRQGEVEANTFGVSGTENWGLIEVFGNVFQDLAALRKIELLPWGWYGLAGANEEAAYSETELIDRLASISSAADGGAIDLLRSLVSTDDRLCVSEQSLAEIHESDLASYAEG